MTKPVSITSDGALVGTYVVHSLAVVTIGWIVYSVAVEQGSVAWVPAILLSPVVLVFLWPLLLLPQGMTVGLEGVRSDASLIRWEDVYRVRARRYLLLPLFLLTVDHVGGRATTVTSRWGTWTDAAMTAKAAWESSGVALTEERSWNQVHLYPSAG